MTELSFGTDARHRLCLSCGESFAVPMNGGDVSCPSCGAPVSIKPRTLEPLAELDAFAETPEQWANRLAILRRQLQSYNRDNKYTFVSAPEGLEPLEKSADANELLVAFRGFVTQCEERGTSSGPQERALFWLASRLRSIMSVSTEPQRVAAIMHTALDVVTDRGFKHGLYCRLVRVNVSLADFDAAEAWLALCDPVSTILDLDSDYRIARAMVSGGRGDWARVLTLVGEDEWAVPYEPAAVALLCALRVSALEKLGRGFEAEEAMTKAIELTPGGNTKDLFSKMFETATVFEGALAAFKRVEPEHFGGAAQGDNDIDIVPGASPNAGYAVGALVNVLFGLAMMGLGVYFLGQYSAEHSWKSTRGTVVNVSSRSVGSGKKAKIRVYVQYRFEVDGKPYDGKYIETGQTYYSYGSDRSASHRIATLRKHPRVKVYYDPKKPEKAILERQNAAFHMVPFVVMGMAWVVALILLWVFWRKRRAYKEKLAAAAKEEAE